MTKQKDPHLYFKTYTSKLMAWFHQWCITWLFSLWFLTDFFAILGLAPGFHARGTIPTTPAFIPLPQCLSLDGICNKGCSLVTIFGLYRTPQPRAGAALAAPVACQYQYFNKTYEICAPRRISHRRVWLTFIAWEIRALGALRRLWMDSFFVISNAVTAEGKMQPPAWGCSVRW